jgi:hypothetical protein
MTDALIPHLRLQTCVYYVYYQLFIVLVPTDHQN